MKDWLGNELELGDLVVYTSRSSNVGMVLGSLTELTDVRIQIKPIAYSGSKNLAKVITLHSWNDAFKAVTKYRGSVNLD
jgi:hypothetical protein